MNSENSEKQKSGGETNTNELHYSFKLSGGDFGNAGVVSTKIKRILQQIGANQEMVRRAAIATYEAEMNIVIHAGSGEVILQASSTKISITCQDNGPGIPDIDLAMQPGYSTASNEIREMGFGAGMGLPNMKRCSDEFIINSIVGEGTTIDMVFKNE